MDPDVMWAKIVRAATEWTDAEDDVFSDGAATELAEAVLTFDEWVAKGGFLPAAFISGGSVAGNVLAPSCQVCGCVGAGAYCPGCGAEQVEHPDEPSREELVRAGLAAAGWEVETWTVPVVVTAEVDVAGDDTLVSTRLRRGHVGRPLDPNGQSVIEDGPDSLSLRLRDIAERMVDSAIDVEKLLGDIAETEAEIARAEGAPS